MSFLSSSHGFRLVPAVLLAAAGLGQPVLANLVGCWTFNDSTNLGKATVGTALTPVLATGANTGTITSVTGITAGDGAALVGKYAYFVLSQGIGANGSSGTPARTNRYSLLVDFKIANDTTQWYSIFQTAAAVTTDDADFFIRKQTANELGVASETYVGASGLVTRDTWHRLVITVDQGVARKTYLDGTLAGSHSVGVIDNVRWSLAPTAFLFGDNDGDDGPITVSNVALYDTPLAAADVTSLGGAGDPIPLPGPNNVPVVTVQTAGPATATALASASYSFSATDPEGANIQMQVDWGNGVFSAWSAQGTSGASFSFSYAWPYSGAFTVKARARDLAGGVSDWVAIQTVTVAAAAGIPDGLVGLWEFDDPGNPGKATYGANLTVAGAAPAYSATLADGQANPNSLQGVITTVYGTANRLLATHNIGANGGGTRVNQYTLLFDVLMPATGYYRSFYQAATSNTGDAEYFVRPADSAIGRTTITYSHEPVEANRWMRIAVSVDLRATGSFLTYLDGALFHTHTRPTFDGEYSLEPSQVLFFADNDNENYPLSVGMVAVFSKTLSASEIAAFGGPGITILPDPDNQSPTVAAAPAGPTSTTTGTNETFTFTAIDPDADIVQVQADWGDGKLSSWSGFGASGASQSLAHFWSLAGSFAVKARARDSKGAVSAWTAIQSVAVTGPPIVTFSTPPYLQNMGTDHMVVMWETAEDVPLSVECGTSTSYGRLAAGARTASGGGTWFHRVLLDSLLPGTVYHYRVTSAAGDPLGADATFRTAPSTREDFSFAVFSDVQTTNNGAWQANGWEPALTMFEHAVGRGASFGLGCGDHAQNGDSYASVRGSHLDRFARHFGCKAPFFIAWGNHDGTSPTDPLRLSADMPSRFRSGLSPGHGNYSFSYAGVFFVCFDNAYYNNEIANGWLASQLSSPEARQARFRVVAIHVPPYCERWLDGNATLRSQLVPLLEQYDVNLCFSGHTHEYERGSLNDVNYVITGGGSYLDSAEVVVQDWAHMTVGGAQNVPGNWAKQSGLGVLGTPQPIVGGLFNEYCQVTVRENFLRLDCHGFNADGSYIGVLDSFSLGTDPGPDTDGDGLRDPWEIANGLDPNSPNGADGAAGDRDGDGATNHDEMIAGTAANDPSSRFQVIQLARSAENIELAWSSVAGRTYGLEWTSDLTNWHQLTDGLGVPVQITAGGPSTSRSFPPPAAPPVFLRVTVTGP